MITRVTKKLRENDLGLTKSHQAGFHIPKSIVNLRFFPELSPSELNPRVRLRITSTQGELDFYANYIHYNNKVLGLGTRDEYRLTGLTGYIRAQGLRIDDEIILTRISDYEFAIEANKQERTPTHLTSESWTALYGAEGQR